MDDPPPHGLRSRHSPFCGGGRRPVSPDHRVGPRDAAGRASRARGRDRGRAGDRGHAGAFDRRVGVAELEVSAPGTCGRHALRPLDADAEAATGRGRAFFDRGLAGRRAHGGRRALRGRGDRSAGQANRRIVASESGREPCARGDRSAAAKKASLASQRHSGRSRTSWRCGASRGCGQARAGIRPITASEATSLWRIGGPTGRARAAGCTRHRAAG